MATVGERFVVTDFTATQKLFLRSSDSEFHWRNARVFVGAIAERLLFGFADFEDSRPITQLNADFAVFS